MRYAIKDSKYHAKHKMAIALRRYLNGIPSNGYKHIFGCQRDFLRAYLEYQFKPGWTWDNHGKEWQIDHIIPVTEFDHANEQDLKMCWNWINLRPIAPSENRSRNPTEDISILLNSLVKRFSILNPVIHELIKKAEELRQKNTHSVDWDRFDWVSGFKT